MRPSPVKQTASVLNRKGTWKQGKLYDIRLTYFSCDVFIVNQLTFWIGSRIDILRIHNCKGNKWEEQSAESKRAQYNSSDKAFLIRKPFPAADQRREVADANATHVDCEGKYELRERVDQRSHVDGWNSDRQTNQNDKAWMNLFRQPRTKRIENCKRDSHQRNNVDRVVEVHIVLASSILPTKVVVVR